MAEPVVRKALTVLDMLGRDPENVKLTEVRMKKIFDEKTMLEGTKKEGKLKGILDSKREEINSFFI